MKSSLKWFDSYLTNFMHYKLLFGEKRHIFSKVHFILKKKHDLILKFEIMF
jgi:hypothetical protein